MNRNQGTATVALIVAALVGMSYFPRGGREAENGPSAGVESKATRTSHTHVPGGAAGAAILNEPCTEIGHLLARFYDGFANVPYPRSCFDPDAKLPALLKPAVPVPADLHLKVVVALMPNPVSTHFSLFFDRAVEAVQLAAQDEGYAYDASWLPWSDEVREYTHLSDDIKNTERKHGIEEQPGILVFREGVNKTGVPPHPYRQGLIVLLVGEQPTQGIADKQFENAMLWFSNLAPEGKDPFSAEPMRILGPTTSGALPSLHRELELYCDVWWNRRQTEIYSGSVSSPTSVEWFLTAMNTLANVGPDTTVLAGGAAAKCKVPPKESDRKRLEPTFHTYNENDDLVTGRFCTYLHDQGYDVSKLAFLSEDETAFGSFVAPEKPAENPESKKAVAQQKPKSQVNAEDDSAPCAVAVQMYYPRDIAALQAAYEKQSVFATGKPAANAPGSTLRSDLSEPTGGEHDTVRAYGGQLDPLSQEVVLQAITEQMREHQIQFVLVRSSNSLDQAFLSQFLRRSYPEGRVVLEASDLLFLRSRQDVSLRGVMVLSTYPLLADQKDWTPTVRMGEGGTVHIAGQDNEKGAIHTFGQDTVESIYLAGRNLLSSNANVAGTAAVAPIYDYLPPRWSYETAPLKDANAAERPATWLTVISRRRFWPLAALTEGAAPANTAEASQSNNTQETTQVTDVPESLLPKASEVQSSKAAQSNAAAIVFPLQMKVLLLACATLAFWHLYCCWFGSVTGPLRALSYFAPLPLREHRQLIFVGSLFIGLMGVVLAIFGGMSVELTTRLWWLLFGTMTCLLLFPTLSIVGNFSLPRLRSRKDIERRDATYFERWRGWPARFVKWRELIVIGVLLLALLLIGYAEFLQLYLINNLTDSNRFPVMWRSVNLLSGVSPLLPQVVLLLGLYGWFWCNLSGAALMGDDRPRLPKEAHFPPLSTDERLPEEQRRTLLRGFSREAAQRTTEQQSLPLGRRWWRVLVACIIATAVVFRVALRGWGVRSLGEIQFGYVMFWWLVLVVSMLLADMVQFVRTWRELQCLLALLDRLTLRRTLAAMKGIAWRSLWRMAGNVLQERYRVLSRQLESMRHLRVELEECQVEGADVALKRIDTCMEKGQAFFRWYVSLSDQRKRGLTYWQWCAEDPEREKHMVASYARWRLQRVDRKLVSDVGPMNRFQAELAETAAVIIGRVLIPAWQKEKKSLLIETEPGDGTHHHEGLEKHSADKGGRGGEEPSSLVRAAEEFFLLHYLGFLQNTLGRIRSMVVGMLMLFVGATLAVSSYPFDPLPVLGGLFLAVFVIVGVSVVSVYASMHRDTTLSYVTNTKPGELGWEFWGQLVTFGIGPLFALLTTLFPSMTDFFLSWIQPNASALK